MDSACLALSRIAEAFARSPDQLEVGAAVTSRGAALECMAPGWVRRSSYGPALGQLATCGPLHALP